MLELRNVGYETDDNKEILHDVSLTVQERFVAITGPNGGGKSTLAKVIAGIYQPTSGQILLDGVDITHMSITDRANLGLSYAFQQPVRFKGLRVKDLLSLAAGKNTSVTEACNYLSEVGLCARDYIDREVNASLSGGELKRIEGHRPVELPEPDPGVREDVRTDPGQHPDHQPSGAYSEYRRQDRRHQGRPDREGRPPRRDPARFAGQCRRLQPGLQRSDR